MPKTINNPNLNTLNASPYRIIAGCMGLAAFSIAVVCGISADNTTDVILFRAIVSMFGSYAIGLFVGMICTYAIQSDLDAYIKSVPIPDSNIQVDDLVEKMIKEHKKNINSTEESEGF